MAATTSRDATKDAGDSAPRKRGRPRKSSTAENVPVQKIVESAPRKRGRPPKVQPNPAQTAPSLKLQDDAAPRKRGRPPKPKSIETPAAVSKPVAKASSETIAPRKRGRPPKADKEAVAKKSTTATLHKRAVPPKNAKPAYVANGDAPNNDSGSETDAGQEADTEDVDHPRKRARKAVATKGTSIDAPVQPKRRGRPPKVHNSDTPTATKTKLPLSKPIVKSAASAEPAKKRGRPRKNAVAKESEVSNVKDVSVKAARKVGRPPKESNFADAEVSNQPKKRGRPPKVKPELAVSSKDSKDTSNGESTLDTGSISALESGADQPRKRGRSPKTQEFRLAEAPKKRGRPPKQPQAQPQKELDHSEQKEQEQSEQEQPEKEHQQKQQSDDKDNDTDEDIIKNPPLSAPANGSSDMPEIEPPMTAPIRIAEAPKHRPHTEKLVPVVEIPIPKAAGLPEEPLKKLPDFSKQDASESELSEGWVSSGVKLAKKVVDLL